MVLLNDHGTKVLLLTRVIMTNRGSIMFGSGDHASFVQWLVTLVNHGLLNDHGNNILVLTRVIITNHGQW